MPKPVTGLTFVSTTIDGAFCQECGACIRKIYSAELRALAAVLVLSREYLQSRVRPGQDISHLKGARPFVARSNAVRDRSGLSHNSAVATLGKLRRLGFLDARRPPLRHYYQYRLSDRVLGASNLMKQIEEAAEQIVLRPLHDIGYPALLAEKNRRLQEQQAGAQEDAR